MPRTAIRVRAARPLVFGAFNDAALYFVPSGMRGTVEHLDSTKERLDAWFAAPSLYRVDAATDEVVVPPAYIKDVAVALCVRWDACIAVERYPDDTPDSPGVAPIVDCVRRWVEYEAVQSQAPLDAVEFIGFAADEEAP